VPKNATAVVDVVSNIAPAASGNACAATNSVDALLPYFNLAFFHLSTATKT